MKKQILLVLVGLAAAMLSACGSLEIRNVGGSREPVMFRNYTLGQAQEAHVGEPVVLVKDYFVIRYPMLTNATAFSARGVDGTVTQYPAGSQARMSKYVSYRGAEYRAVSPVPPLSDGSQLLIDAAGHYRGLALFRGDFSEPCDDEDIACIQPADVTFVASTKTLDEPEPNSHFLNYEIIYSGASKDALHLLYREYTPDNLVRPAFTQNLTYERGTTTIRFREHRIQVLDANNERLRYIVEADGLEPMAGAAGED